MASTTASRSSSKLLRVAACHASPIFLSARATTDKTLSLISQAASRGANLVVFPESFIPAFPLWSALRPPTDNHALFKRMASQSIDVVGPGPEMLAIRAAARKHGVLVSIGFSESVPHSSCGTLYNSNMIIGTEGQVLVHHRKLMPTFFEKLTWSPGDGAGLRVADAGAFGKIGNLICGENSNPLARYALMAQGEQVHISSWPAVWPTRATTSSSGGDGSGGGGKNYDNVSANRIRAAAHCFEAKCFGVMSAGMLDQDAINTISAESRDDKWLADCLASSPRAATMFLDPTGAPLQGFVFTGSSTEGSQGEIEKKDMLQNEEGILYADMDLDDCVEGKQYHDVSGGYQRLDVLQLKVDRTRRAPATFVEEGDGAIEYPDIEDS